MAELNQARPIFHAVLALDADKRGQYLDVACEDDEQLRSMVESLLVAHQDADQFMEDGAMATEDYTAAPVDESRQQIDRYKLLQKIGEGGFGVVYMAEQQTPVVRRVALKIIKPGMDTKQVIARFEAERQALALMEHPNIAQVFDAGETDNGRPYFVMELVRGVSITEFCDEQKLTNRRRLALFKVICDAIQHAHQKGIIHRDLKPSNVLVTMDHGEPVPKVIDFGIAKATQQRLTDKTLFTRFEQFMGTPAYMSPEQAQMSSLDVDTRSDVYSLGVLLYELLTGTTPLDVKQALQVGLDELCRRICEEEFQTPSTRVSSLGAEKRSTLASNRGLDANTFEVGLRGDLDWIVMKAVDKDRRRRYDTANAFAADIERYLQQEPVSAVPPSAAYRFRKFVRRNQAAVLMTMVVTFSLIIGTVLATVGMVRAVHEAEDARVTNDKLASQMKRARTAERAALEGEYLADMQAAHQALTLNNLALARQILEKYRHIDSDYDPRNWEWYALWTLCRGNALRSFRVPSRYIESLSISHDGEWAATGSQHGSLVIWNTATNDALFPREDSKENRWCNVAFSPESNELLVTSYDGTIASWNIPSLDKAEREFQHDGPIHTLRISADNRWLAAAGLNASTSMWDLKTGEPKQLIDPDTGEDLVNGFAAFSHDGARLAITRKDGTIRIIDIQTLKEHQVIESQGAGNVRFTPDGRFLLSNAGWFDHGIRVHRLDDGELVSQLTGHGLEVVDFNVSPDSKKVATASADQTVRLWDIKTGDELAVFRQHSAEVHTVVFTPNGRQIISTALDGEVCVWDASGPGDEHWPLTARGVVCYHCEREYFKQFSQVCFSSDGSLIATRDPQQELTLLSAETLQPVMLDVEAGNELRGLRWSPTKNVIAVGTTTGALALVDLDQPEQIQRKEIRRNANISPIGFSNTGDRVLILAEYEPTNFCAIVETEDLELVATWDVPPEILCAAMSPTGDGVITGHGTRDIYVWSVDALEKPTVLPTRATAGADFSPDGRFAVVGGPDGLIQILDVNRGEFCGELAGHMQGCHSVKFSPDGTRVASGGHDVESVKVWDFATRRQLLTLETTGNSFRQVEWSPDGRSILAVGGVEKLCMWRVPSLEEIEAFEEQTMRPTPR